MKHSTVAFVHCIENKHERMYERQAWLFTETFKHTNSELYNACRHYFLQPTEHDIDQKTIDYFDNQKINFIQNSQLNQKQLNATVNYTNICVTTAYFSEQLNEEYLCWSDTDVLWLGKTKGEFFGHTDKPVINIFPVTKSPTKNFSLQEYDAFDTRFQLDEIYQEHFKPYLDPVYQVDQLTHYANTWFIYCKTKHPFWKEWKELTFLLIDIIHKNQNKYINHHIECYCEEIAASILYSLNPDNFTLLEDFFGEVFVMAETGNPGFDNFSTQKVLYHYTGLFEKPYAAIDENKDPARIVTEFLMQVTTRDVFDFDIKSAGAMCSNYLNSNK